MIDVINLQRKVKIDTAAVKVFVEAVTASVDETAGKAFSVAFVSDDRMRQLNNTFRGKDGTTDVLSFPYEPDDFGVPTEGGAPDFLGDIVISTEQAERQAKDNKLTLQNEIEQLILHGVLHLCGYDHEIDNGEMNARELELRKLLKID